MRVLANRNIFTLVSLLAVSLLVGCSSDGKSSQPQTMLVYVQAGQGNIENAFVRSAIIQNNGVLDTSGDGRVNAGKVLTDDRGLAAISVLRTQMHHFNLVSRDASKDRLQVGSSMSCQWVAGCQQNGKNIAFGASINPPTNWVASTWGLAEKEKIYVTPLTTLADALAQHWLYDERNSNWLETAYYSPQSVVQAQSQISKLFGLQNTLTQPPADLARLQHLKIKDATLAKDSIRYGALVAAWLHLQEVDSNFTEQAVEEYLQTSGGDVAQVLEKDSAGTKVLTLDILYSQAKNNLQALIAKGQLKGQVKALANEVVADLTKQLGRLDDGEYTDVWPDSMREIFGDKEAEDYSLGLLQAKAFVKELNGLSEQFFDTEYQARIQQYRSTIKNLSDTNRADYDAMLTAIIKAEQDYRTACSTAAANCSYNGLGSLKYKRSASAQNDMYLELSVTGNYQQGNLKLALNDVKDSKGVVTDASYLRVYFGAEHKVSKLISSGALASAQPLAYELHWADFNLYDSVANQAEQVGQLHIFYRGVEGSSGVRFNIEKYELNSKLSDVIGDAGKNDKDVASLYVGAQSTNASSYYGANEFAPSSLDEFFTPTILAPVPGTNLVSYAFGQETLSSQKVEYLDIYVEGGESNRYRFYPSMVREDTTDVNGNGNLTERITTHDMSICVLKNDSGEWKVDGTCSPKQRFYEKRDIQRTINTLWKAGAFSYINISGQGEYFVEWPATKVNGCYELDALDTAGASLDGTLISQEVLGLNNLRLTSEILLKDTNAKGELVDLPKTMLDLKMYKPTAERINLSYALSNNYSGVSSDDVFLGTGNDMNRIIFNYNTDSAFSRVGNIAFYKGGVSIQPDGAISASKVNGELFFGFAQAYDNLPHKYVIGPDGDETVCITQNQPLDRSFDDNETKYSLAFGGVVYGTILNQGGTWKAVFTDGTEQAMNGFEHFFEMAADFKVGEF